MANRVCTRCGEPKDTEQFAWKSQAKGRRHSHCRSCQGKISTKHYQSNKDEYIARAQGRYADNRVQNKSRLALWFEEKKCAFCPETSSQALGFIHKPGEDKKSTILRLLGQTWETVLEEIAKCDIICANCRKKRKS